MAKKIKIKNQIVNPAVASATSKTVPAPSHRPRKVVIGETPAPTPFTKKQQTHGNIEEGPAIFAYLKGREFPYTEKTLKEYQLSLAKMSKNQLHEEMMKVNLIPNITERTEIVLRLEKAYLEKQASFLLRYTKSAIPASDGGIDADRAASIISILNR